MSDTRRMRGRRVQIGWWTLTVALAATGQGKGGLGWNRGSTYAEGAPAPLKFMDGDVRVDAAAFAGDFYDDDLEEVWDKVNGDFADTKEPVGNGNIKPSDDFDSYVRKASNKGIAVETHKVTTDDGYILTLKRMYMAPEARNGEDDSGDEGSTNLELTRPVVFIQHGLLASSWSWLVNGADGGPAFVLANAGYDVWMGNNRGNTFSREHRTLSPDEEDFWQFSFEDMARYDVVASIDHTLATTGADSLSYVGWSQGTTQMFIAGLPEFHADRLKDKVNIFIALSPVTFLGHCKSVILNAMTYMGIANAVSKLYDKGFLLGPQWQHSVESTFCWLTFGIVCRISAATICGSSSLDDGSAVTDMAAHFPAGTSVKDMVHWEQGVSSEKFARYDYGKDGNLAHYDNKNAPSYDLSQHSIPTALLTGTHDDLVAEEDLEALNKVLPESSVVFRKSYKDFSHMTWVVGKKKAWGWMDDMKDLLNRYNPVANDS